MEKSNTFIIKRDGSKVPFDSNRISVAVTKALRATGHEDVSKDVIKGMIYGICSFLKEKQEIPTVEQCQDAVEIILMEQGFHDTAKAYILYREKHASLRGSAISEEWKEASKKAVSYFPSYYEYLVYLRTYSKWNDKKKRRETWPETITRFMDFMKEIVKDKLSNDEYNELETAILKMEVMPSMRMLQFSGEAVRRNNICAYNCSFVAPQRLRDFHDTMLILMCGTGVGFSVERKFVEKLPVIQYQKDNDVPDISSSPVHPELSDSLSQVLENMGMDNNVKQLARSEETGKLNKSDNEPITRSIEDSREGWCKAFLIGLETWYSGKDIKFDYSLLRPSGARLITSGGRASGPAPLKELLDFSREIILENQGGRLSTINVHDLMCKIGQIVLVGGVRRSSEISISDLDDEAMRNAKMGAFWNTHPDRTMANNSAAYNKKPSDTQLLTEWTALVNSGSGERGIFNRSNLAKQIPKRRMKNIGNLIKDMGTNPCVTDDTWIQTVEGPMQVKELIGNPVNLMVNGKEKKVLSKGFFQTGKRPLLKLTTKGGSEIIATENHPMYVIVDGKQKKKILSEIIPGDCICLDYNKVGIVSKIQHFYKHREVYDVTVEDHQFIANGFLVGNCGEILLLPYEFCNLSSVILRENDTRESIIRKTKLAAILGTYQSMLTDFKNIAPEWKKLAEMERLLGVSLNGQRDCRYLRENIEILDILKYVAVETNRIYAEKFGINQSAAVTTVKPEGTTSQMLGTSNGLHPRYFPYYIRRIRITATDPLSKLLIDQGVAHYPENGQNIDNVNTWVFEFPQKSPDGAVCLKDITALDQLNYWKEVKVRYTEHNPSCTVNVRRDEWITVLNWIKDNWDIVGGLSFLPYDEHVYKLAPYEEITKEEYNKKVIDMPDIDFAKLIMFEKEDSTERKQQWACIGDKCELK